MYIFGDFSIPYDRIFVENGEIDGKEHSLINCEGYLVDGELSPGFNRGVFVNVNALKKVGNPEQIILAFANNHVMDSSSGVNRSTQLAQDNGFLYLGAGETLSEAIKPLTITEHGKDVSIINAGWNLIGCCYAKVNAQGVNPLNERRILKEIKRQKSLGKKVLLYLHWGYETERYPLPLHREMAFRFVDAGADFIVGCHAHCLQGYEIYKNAHIFYGIGNSSFQQGFYYDGMLNHPSYCDLGAAVNWNPKTNKIKVHIVTYNSSNKKMKFLKSGHPLEVPEIKALSGFSKLNSKQYVGFFRENRVKKKGLPIFSGKDHGIKYCVKFYFVFIRGKIIDLLVLLGLKR